MAVMESAGYDCYQCTLDLQTTTGDRMFSVGWMPFKCLRQLTLKVRNVTGTYPDFLQHINLISFILTHFKCQITVEKT